MLKIRLQRIGRRNNPSYRVVVVESTVAARKGKPVELLGTYDTIRKTTSLNNERIQHWLSVGAQASDTMHNILIKNGVIEGVAVNTLPKKSPVKKKKDAADGAEAEQKSEAQASTGDAPKDTAEPAEPAGDTKDEAPKQEVKTAEQSNTDDTADTDAEKPSSPPPQDTPSTEG
ncbi:MAG: 30S ribosomal protein S16 [Candidatus Kaiserbacteria bacterium]|nr:30S ribosomal protein S16 [Candidatus Kaiserbacteria bacterium]